jgi:cytochrome P450
MCFVSLQGHDTTSAGISWALYLLGLHADVQVYTDIIFGFTGTKTQNVIIDIQEVRRGPQTAYFC